VTSLFVCVVLDYDECLNDDMLLCSHQCINVAGSYYCTCAEGYQLRSDGYGCEVLNGMCCDKVHIHRQFVSFLAEHSHCHF
jgi:hypothetical protein